MDTEPTVTQQIQVPPPPALPVQQPVIPDSPDPTPINDGSQILGVSLRGLIALLLVITVCFLAITKVPISEQFNNIIMMVLGVYFGHTIGLAQGRKQ